MNECPQLNRLHYSPVARATRFVIYVLAVVVPIAIALAVVGTTPLPAGKGALPDLECVDLVLELSGVDE